MANRWRLGIFIALAGVLLAACAGAEPHERTIWYVSTTGDDTSSCAEPDRACRTFSEALGRANADDKIIIAAGTYNEILPAAEDGSAFTFTGGLWITGAGIDETILDMRGSTGLQIFWGTTILENFTIQNSATDCIWVSRAGSTTIENVEARNCARAGFRTTGENILSLINVISSGNRDGAEVNSGELIIEGGQFTGNTNDGIASSGGNSSLAVSSSTIEDNARYGIYMVGGTTVLSDLTITGNGSVGGPFDSGVRISGGNISIRDSLIDANVDHGLFASNDSELLVEDSLFTNNGLDAIFVVSGHTQISNVTVAHNCDIFSRIVCDVFGSAITNEGGTMTINNSLITQNETGGLFNGVEDGNVGEMSVTETTVSENLGMCAVNNQGNAVITHSLVAHNTAARETALPGICNLGDLSLLNTTVSNNGIGVLARDGELAMSFVTIAENAEYGLGLEGVRPGLVRRLDNALIVNNGTFDCINDHDISTFSFGGTNIDSDSSCDSFFTYSTDELAMGSLADNGGPTFTHALLPESPAIDAASSSCPESDQRLSTRPVGPSCDVGAYEAGAVATSLEVTPTPDSEITVTILQDARCRTGPDFIYPDYDFFEPGQTTTVFGRSADSNWFYVQALSFSGKCFIGKAVLQFDVDPEVLLALPVIQPLPTPTPTLDPDESYDVTETPKPPKPTACPTLINNPGSCK